MSTHQELHDSAVVIDGLIISDWNRQVFEDMRRGGITAANCTCSVWEGFRETTANIAQWKAWFEEHADVITQVHVARDIERAKTEGRVGIILGWQNTSGIEDRLSFVRLFRDLGVRVMQLTYNTQNLVGSGCMESRDSGLSDFGRDLIDEMNRCGVLIDLSHVGPKTSEDAIRYSKKPVTFTHCGPYALLAHPRNKTDDAFRLIAKHGGFVGVTTYPPFLSADAASSLDDAVAAIEHVMNIVGEDAVGIGTDFTQGQSAAWFDWLCHDKGNGRRIVERTWDVAPFPKDLGSLADFPNVTAAMMRRGWDESRTRKVLGENWLRLLGEVWGE
jgi:membrane dipeptidase